MTNSEQKRFDLLYQKHLRAQKLRGMSDKTIDAYSRAVRGSSNTATTARPTAIQQHRTHRFQEKYQRLSEKSQSPKFGLMAGY